MSDRERQTLRLLAPLHPGPHQVERVRGLLNQPLDWTEIAQLAEAHGVFPTVVRNLDRLGWPHVPGETRQRLEIVARLNAVRNHLLVRGLQSALAQLARAGIPAIPLKGVALADSLYGDVTLRACSDVDVLVPPSQVGPALEVLRTSGYRSRDRYRVGAMEVDRLLRSNMEYCLVSSVGPLEFLLELHWDIAWRWYPGSRLADDLWAAARPGTVLGVEAWMLGPEWELLYLAVHAARHRWSHLKWLVDIHQICERGGLQWADAEDRAGRLGLERVLYLTLAACRSILDTRLPSRFERHAPPRGLDPLASPGSVGGWGDVLSAVRLFRRPADKLRYLGRLLLQPALAEWQLVRLPRGLGLLYYPLRPVRLGVTSGCMVVKAGLARLLS